MTQLRSSGSELIERLPPQSKEAERSVLGSILRDNNCLDDVLCIIRPEHFYFVANQILLREMINIRDSGKAIDLVILGDHLNEGKQVEEIGGYGYLAELWDAAPTAANAEYYATIVRDKAILRNLIHAATEILRDAYEPFGPAQEVLEGAEKLIFRVGEKGLTSNSTIDMSAVMEMVLERINERTLNPKQKGITTGLVDLDQKTGGWQNSELVIVAARPSAGKTAITSTFISAAAKAGHNVLFFTLEQSKIELGERFLIAASEVDSKVLRSGVIESGDVDRLVTAGGKLKELPVWFDDVPGQTYLQIASKARRMRRRHGIELVVIDYLQLIVSDDRRPPRHEQVAEISRRLKELARELKIPVICLAQLNRECEHRDDKRPRISDLRESGAIEQDADVVILLHRPEMYDVSVRPGEADLIVAKQRNGPTGDVTVSYVKQFMKFGNFQFGDSPT